MTPVAARGEDASRKLRGGYYTPAPIAAHLARWAVRSPADRVLEPSAGDGAFVRAVLPLLGDGGRIVAVEQDVGEAEKVLPEPDTRVSVHALDFFAWQAGLAPASFDAVVGNPPFIRFQDFADPARGRALDLMAREGLRATRLTNAWLPFVVGATRLLGPGGRLALVLPAELLQVGYAAGLRAWLAQRYTHLTVVTFRRLVFPGIQQETLLLLGERGDVPAARIEVLEVDDAGGLPEVAAARPAHGAILDHAGEKWTRFLLPGPELDLLRAVERAAPACRLGDVASVDVGVVTGRNEFFVLSPGEAEARGVRGWCLPMVGRSAQVPGLRLRRADWDGVAAAGGRCLLLQLGSTPREALSPAALAWVEHGERQGFHEGFKCRIRLPAWWHVPSTWVPDAFLLRQIHDAPRVIVNEARTTCTDTIHRLRCRPGVPADRLAAAFLNSATLAFSEIVGRSYGGGVLELEPREAEQLWFPGAAALAAAPALDDLEAILRRGGLGSALDAVDRAVLGAFGLSDAEVRTVRGCWARLSARRRARKAVR